MRSPSDSENSAGLAELIRLRQAGDWGRSERVCRDILGRDAGHPLALLVSAEIALARGDRVTAQTRIRRALKPASADRALLTQAIRLAQQTGDLALCGDALAALLRIDPRNFAAQLMLGQVSEARGRAEDAVAAYEAAAAVLPGHAGPDTARALLLLRRAWGEPLPAPEEKRQKPARAGRIAMTTLGQNGRFGNQLFQYCFLRLYGESHGLRAEVPDWVGRWLFDLDDPRPGAPLPRIETSVPLVAAALGAGSPPDLAGRDLIGYGQCHTRHFRPHQARVRALLRPGERARVPAERALARLRSRGETVVAIHLRRGDYTGGDFAWPAPSRWYLDWLETVWGDLARPVLYVASDDAGVAGDFAAYGPVTTRELGETIPGAEMYLDFAILAQADLLAISNSTFSMMAAMLSEAARAFLRPEPNQRRLIPFDPWDCETMLKAEGTV